MAREPLTGQIITAGTPSTDPPEVLKLKARIAELEALANKAPQGRLTYRVNPKTQALEVYGLGTSRYPVSMHIDGWDSLFAQIDTIKGFCQAERPNLPTLKAFLDGRSSSRVAK